MKIIGGILRFLFDFVLVMLLKDLYDLFIAYRKYRNKLNGRAIKRLRRMRGKRPRAYKSASNRGSISPASDS